MPRVRRALVWAMSPWRTGGRFSAVSSWMTASAMSPSTAASRASPVQRVGDDGLSAEAGEQRPVARAAGEAVDVVAARHERPVQGTPMVPVDPATKTFILPPHSSPPPSRGKLSVQQRLWSLPWARIRAAWVATAATIRAAGAISWIKPTDWPAYRAMASSSPVMPSMGICPHSATGGGHGGRWPPPCPPLDGLGWRAAGRLPGINCGVADRPVRHVRPAAVEAAGIECGRGGGRQHSVAVQVVGSRLGGGQEPGAQPAGLGAQGQHGGQPPPVADAAGGDHQHQLGRVDHGGHQRHRGHLAPAHTAHPARRPRPRRQPTGQAPCGCRIFGYVMRPAHTHGSAHRVDLAAQPSQPTRRQLTRQARVAAPVPSHDADGARCSGRRTRPASTPDADVRR